MAFAAINFFGIRPAAAVSNLFTLGKLIPLFLFVAIGLFFVDTARFSFTAPPTASAFTASVLLLLFAFSGFGSALVPAGEMRDPRRDVPFALLTAIGLVAVLYFLVQVVSIGTLPELARSDRPLADASARFLGRARGALVASGALIASLGVLHVLMLATARLPFAMAEQGQVPRVFGTVHPRYRSPWVSIVVSAAAMWGLAISGTFVYSATISTISRLFIMMTSCAALPVLRLRESERAPFVAPAGWLVSSAALALCVWLLSSSPWRHFRDVAIAAAAGLVLYVSYRARRRISA